VCQNWKRLISDGSLEFMLSVKPRNYLPALHVLSFPHQTPPSVFETLSILVVSPNSAPFLPDRFLNAYFQEKEKVFKDNKNYSHKELSEGESYFWVEWGQDKIVKVIMRGDPTQHYDVVINMFSLVSPTSFHSLLPIDKTKIEILVGCEWEERATSSRLFRVSEKEGEERKKERGSERYEEISTRLHIGLDNVLYSAFLAFFGPPLLPLSNSSHLLLKLDAWKSTLLLRENNIKQAVMKRQQSIIQQRKQGKRSVECVFYKKGKCKYGSSCHFLHLDYY